MAAMGTLCIIRYNTNTLKNQMNTVMLYFLRNKLCKITRLSKTFEERIKRTGKYFMEF